MFSQFNLTGLIWSEKFDCEPKPETWPIIWLPILVTVLAFIITYGCEPFLVPRLWPGRLRRNTDLGKETLILSTKFVILFNKLMLFYLQKSYEFEFRAKTFIIAKF